MPVNQALSTYSDMAYATSVVVYIFAMLLYFGEFAYGRPAKAARKRESALVGAGGESTGDAGVGHVEQPRRRPLPERLGGMAVAMTVLGALVHAASLGLRGFATGRVPWGNMYEFGSAICLAAVVAWLVVLVRQLRTERRDATPAQLRGLGGFLLLPMIILLFLSGTVLYARAAPLQPALQSYWIIIHVSAAIVSSGVLLFAGVASVLFMLRSRYENNPLKMRKFGSRLPTTQALDRMAYRTTVIIFPVWTFAIIAGAIWAEAAWGRFWGWDPKETCSFIAWVVYAAYLHARATAGWRGVRAAWINIFGLAVMIFNLFFINIVVAGLHSYAGL
ncbi:cytochrome c-type biogenesis protein CcsB [Saccharopolyspora erythraea NRRL 2338]|uniref:Cytochrome c assembly membrane protein n=2 Tax=Saccharopolyspora erythraea TaxID=1836 RepID=A4FPW8_SACEN|nr:c-type cytochrome biogenesis protein CcsB [Saccharopolyspora erythraea]EQD84539.1 cytochrome C assembly protein [Saccharopolyspora erythraea D]PFG99738.1 cytochrome c-type biogenesis protein CcsB [Saccharopolyspora erythraea NRRL 2338]QRK89616.1 c-type cytochrome biogenesis protein CcsB [Saccharopolyspora erythraea]CAM06093.1 cytochrome c assembly membrane protein [Saccharopolyspora erythraea NRRL 2338]